MKTKQILRWFAVVPGALLAGLLISFPVHWVVMIIQLFDRPEEAVVTIGGKGLLAAIPPEVLERLGLALFGSFGIVAAGAWIAPHYKFVTAIVLAGAVVAFVVFTYLYAASLGIELVSGPFHRVLTHVLQLFGLSWAVYYAHQVDKGA